MSALDTRLPEVERNEYLDEIRSYLPAFLSSATIERHDPVGDVSELLNLKATDLERVVAIHILLTEEVGAFVQALPAGLREPISSSIREREVSQAVRGSIDWGGTIRERCLRSNSDGHFVVRPARRIFDTPENRSLVWTIEQLQMLLKRIPSAGTTEDSGADWSARIQAMKRDVGGLRRPTWMHEISGCRPNAKSIERLKVSRRPLYATHCRAVLALLERYLVKPNQDDIVELLAQRFFEPSQDWRLFELVVALRLARCLQLRSSDQRRHRLLVGTSRAPYAVYRFADGSEIALWYQSWPSPTQASIQRDARHRYSITGNDLRPDIVVEHRRTDGVREAVVLELKASRNSGYLAEGLGQLISYIHDRPTHFLRKPCGWLVAPASDAFRSRPSEELALWAVSADDVADACAVHFLGNSPDMEPTVGASVIRHRRASTDRTESP